MSDPQRQEMEQAGNVGLVPAPDGIAEGEMIFNVNLSSKAQDFGDGGDVSSVAESSLRDSLIIKSEVDGGASMKTPRSDKSVSPASKRTSKRKRKNRRRREKKAIAGTRGPDEPKSGDVATPGVEEYTGTETEFSQNSEDVNKGDETGTESEGTVEFDKDESSICVEPVETTVSSLPEDDSLLGAHALPDNDDKKGAPENEDMFKSQNSGVTHSVDTLLKIAKCKIMSQVLRSTEEPEDNTLHSTGFHTDSMMRLIVPPCSPSSLHSINNTGNSTDTINSSGSSSTSREPQKSALKNVHFEEGPPQVVTVDTNPSEEAIFELNLENQRDALSENHLKKNSSKETIVLNHINGTVGNTDSATSSVASDASAASLLKGNGSSSEDFVESSHYPSRENVDTANEQPGQTSDAINVAASRETIQIFKVQNPIEAQYISNEVDSILSRSIDKFTSLMESTAGGKDDNIAPIFVNVNETRVQSQTSLERVERNKPNSSTTSIHGSQNVSVLEHSDDGNIINSSTASEYSAGDANDNLNTTFTIDKSIDESDPIFDLRPISPGDVLPRPIPDTVSDTESVGAVGGVGTLSIVVEEEEVEDDKTLAIVADDNIANLVQEDHDPPTPPLMQSASSASTVIETVASVQQLKPETTTETTKLPDSVSDHLLATPGAVSETESANDEDSQFSNNVPNEVHPNLLPKHMAARFPSSASSTKSSVPSPRNQEDVNENSFGTVGPTSHSRPSTTGAASSESALTESEFEEMAESKQSVEVFTLHFPSNTDAPASQNNLESGNGDQPYFDKTNCTEVLAPLGAYGTSVHERKDATLLGRETETDSDFPWRSDRKTILQQAIFERETTDDSASIEVHSGDPTTLRSVEVTNGLVNDTEKRPEENEEDRDNDGNSQGCCAKMCVIT